MKNPLTFYQWYQILAAFPTILADFILNNTKYRISDTNMRNSTNSIFYPIPTDFSQFIRQMSDLCQPHTQLGPSMSVLKLV